MHLDTEFLKTLERLRFASARARAGGGRCDRRGRHRGRGLEFADHRPYAQGDDFRHIDWKAYRRIGRLLVRLFDEEQDLSVYLFLDRSRSMAAHGKFELAVRLAAALCYIGVAHLDRVSILPFADRMDNETSTGHVRATMAGVLKALDALTPDGRTDLWRSIQDFCGRSRRQGLVILLSDFLDPDGIERGLALLSARGHDVVAVHIRAGADRDGPSAADDGEAVLVDAETGVERRILVSPALLAAHAVAWRDFDGAVSVACARTQAQYLAVDSERPVEEIVLATLRDGRFLR